MTTTLDADTAVDAINRLFTAQAVTAIRLRHSAAGERVDRLRRLLLEVERRRDAIAAAEAADLGKHPAETLLTEVMSVVGEAKHAIAHVRRWMKPHAVRPTLSTFGTRARIVCQPRGRCLVISPWNYPLSLALGPLISAVAAGNTVILKPSEYTVHTNDVLEDIVRQVFAAEEVALVRGAMPTATHLLGLPFDHVFFTGSPAVGRIVMTAAARNLASVTLELGGKSPIIIDKSANIQEAATHLVWGKCVNAGQTCIAPDYLYVHRDVAPAFRSACQSVIEAWYGRGEATSTRSPDLARMISPRHAERVAAMLDEARAHGARILSGGIVDSAARYVAPTLIESVPDDARLMQEEIFAPVLPIREFTTLDPVIDHINAGPKPLALYVWAKDAGVIEAVRTRTSSGSFCVNLVLQQFAHHHLPFGGVNTSGMGSAHGVFGFRAFSHERAEMAAGPWSALKWLFPPYTDAKRRLIEFLIRHAT